MQGVCHAAVCKARLQPLPALPMGQPLARWVSLEVAGHRVLHHVSKPLLIQQMQRQPPPAPPTL
eukprot:737135-Hanusia_phi.AAC.1